MKKHWIPALSAFLFIASPLWARYYDPALGRFITPDAVMTGLHSQGFNPYSYCENNPATLVDPSGHMPSEAGNGSGASYFNAGIWRERTHEKYGPGFAAAGAGLTRTRSMTGSQKLRSKYFSWDWGRKKFFNKASVPGLVKSGLNLGRMAVSALAAVFIYPETLGDATRTGCKPSALDSLLSNRFDDGDEDDALPHDFLYEAEEGSLLQTMNEGKLYQWPDIDIRPDTLYYVTGALYDSLKYNGIPDDYLPYSLYAHSTDASTAYVAESMSDQQLYSQAGIIASIVGNKYWVGPQYGPQGRQIMVLNRFSNAVFNMGIDTLLSDELTYLLSPWKKRRQ